MNMAMIPKLYTYQDIAAHFKVCVRTATKWCKKLRVFRLGNTIRVPESEIQKLLQAHGVKRTRRPSIRVSNDTGTP